MYIYIYIYIYKYRLTNWSGVYTCYTFFPNTQCKYAIGVKY